MPNPLEAPPGAKPGAPPHRPNIGRLPGEGDRASKFCDYVVIVGRFSLPGGEHAAMRKAGERTLASVRCPMRGGVDREPHPSNWRLRTARDQSPARRL